MKKIAISAFLAAFASSVIVLILYYRNVPFLEGLDGKVMNEMFVLRGQTVPDPAIAIIAIDEKSLREMGRWPWTRRRWAEFIRKVSLLQPRLIVLDVWFSEKEDPKADRTLQAAFLKSGRVILPVVFQTEEPSSFANISRWAIDGDDIKGASPVPEGRGVISSLRSLNEAAAGIGHINVVFGRDGTIRWTPLLMKYDGRYYPSLALVSIREFMRELRIKANLGDRVECGNTSVLTDEFSKMLINYHGGAGTYPRYSLTDVIHGRVKASSIKGKILLVGATAQGIYDMRVTPLSSTTPGVEVNANILDNMIHGDFLVRRPLQRLFDIAVILFFGVFLGLIVPRVRAALAMPFAMAVALGYASVAFYFFTRGYWLSTVYPVLSIVFSYLSAASVRLFTAEKKVLEVRRIFSNYVSTKVVDELIRNPEKAELGGQMREMTVMFCDLKGFTGYNERHSPQQVVSMLNEYFEAMTQCIIAYDGTLDKFLGDGVMAFWNAPLEQKNHPELAVRCALEMIRKFEVLRNGWKDTSGETMEFGIGINTGQVLVGNIGASGRRMEYTAIGDAVNMTHRMMGEARRHDREIVVSEDFCGRVRDVVDVEEIGNVKLKGKAEPVTLFAVRGLKKR